MVRGLTEIDGAVDALKEAVGYGRGHGPPDRSVRVYALDRHTNTACAGITDLQPVVAMRASVRGCTDYEFQPRPS